MKNGETIIFINPELLRSECGFEMLKDYLASNTPESFSRISDIVDGELVIESPDLKLGGCISTADSIWINSGYWKVTVESLREFIGIE